MRRICALFLALALALSLSACRENKPEPTPSPTVEPTPTPEPTVERDVLEVYQEALERLLTEHIDPDPKRGHYEDYIWEDLGQIEFAVCDVDVDGEQELIMRHADTYMAGQYTAVYRYDTEAGELAAEFGGTASCRFYDNGTAQDDLSHNQGYSKRFWPFIAYEYNTQAKEYQEIRLIDAWELEYMKEVGLESNYPAEVDKEGAGFVYYSWDDETAKMSQKEYDAWYDSIFGDAEEIEVNYQPLTVSNVANLYYQGIRPKVAVNVVDQWLNYDMWSYGVGGFGKLVRLSARQNDLLEELPVDKLPKKAAEEWGREQIWEDTLLPMCYDEKNDFTVYAVVTEESARRGGYLEGSGILLRTGEYTIYYPVEHEQFWTFSNPLMVVRDFDEDGEDEAAVRLLSGRGTGCAVYTLYIFDLDTLFYETVDFSGIDIDVSYDQDSKSAVLSCGKETLTLDLSGVEGFSGIAIQNVIRYIEQDGKLLCDMGLEIMMNGQGYQGDAVAEVIWDGEKYTLGTITLVEDYPLS